MKRSTQINCKLRKNPKQVSRKYSQYTKVFSISMLGNWTSPVRTEVNIQFH